MGKLIVGILTWFASFGVATLIAKVAGLVVFSGVAMVMTDYLVEMIEGAASGAPQQWLSISRLMGLWEAIGVVIGALALRITLQKFEMGPSSAITGGGS